MVECFGRSTRFRRGLRGECTRVLEACAQSWTCDRSACGGIPSVHRSIFGGCHSWRAPTCLVLMGIPLERRSYPALFTAREACEREISQHQLRYDPRFRAVTFGVHRDERMTEEHPTPQWADSEWMEESLKLRAVAMAIPGIVAGGASAARLFGLPLPNRLRNDHLHLVTFDHGRKVSRKGITVRRRGTFEAGYWLELPMCSPVGVFLDLAAVLTRDELVEAGDAIVGKWHGPPLCSLESLRAQIKARRYLKYRGRVESALSMIRESVDSPQETGLRLWVVNCGLPEPVVHPQVYCPLLNCTVEPDLGYPHAKLALEYEGDQHRTSKSQWARDITRYEALTQQGWVVLRVTSQTNRHLLELKIRHHLDQHHSSQSA